VLTIALENFFNSDNVEKLIVDSTLHLPSTHLCSLVRRGIRLILDAQFATCKWLPGRIWLTKLGSGQGLELLSDLSDSAFRNLVEADFDANLV
jgi:hypothetical protein